jgi:hypothetical protein
MAEGTNVTRLFVIGCSQLDSGTYTPTIPGTNVAGMCLLISHGTNHTYH